MSKQIVNQILSVTVINQAPQLTNMYTYFFERLREGNVPL